MTIPAHPDLHLHMDGPVAVVRLTRPGKRNALNDALVLALADVFSHLPDTARAAVLHGEGDHFCAGLDLSELQTRDAAQGMHHSRLWHHAFARIPSGSVPVVAALPGAVVWPRLAIDALAAQLATCAGAVGVDSGLSHIAVALDLPHVQIYNIDTAWRTGPQGRVHQRCVFARPTPSVELVWQTWLEVVKS